MTTPPLNSPLLPHQQLALQWMQQRHFGLLAYSVGTGKTLPALHAALQASTHYNLPSIYITLASLRLQTLQELQTHIPSQFHRAIIIQGTPQERATLYKHHITPHTLLIMSYETTLSDIDILTDNNSNPQFAAIIADECTRLSNPKNKQSKALQKLTTRSKHRYALTGTPVQNSPTDVYGIFNWLHPQLLGNWFSFMQTYTIRHPTMNYVLSTRNHTQLAAKLAPHYIQCKREDVLLSLPVLSSQLIPVQFTPKEQSLYAKLKEGFIHEIQSELTKVHRTFTLQQLLPRIGKLLEITDSLQLVSDSTQSSKLDTLHDLVNNKLSLTPTSKLIIFTRYSRMAKIIHESLTSFGSLLITGDTSMEERQKIVTQLNDDPTRLILVGTRSLEYGLNLQKSASIIVHYDTPFSYASLVQREARAHRHGQTKPVQVYSLYVQNTLEERIIKKLSKKKELSEELFAQTWEEVMDML